ncbi:MAG: hypothetical protein ABIZ52_03095 [Candidatus Limnocylindrales bacterium]
MTEGPAPAGRSTDLAPAAAAADDGARRAQFLATEHWSLLATRSMSWNEAFTRTSMFLSTLSAATVALALAGPAMSFGGAFALFAVIVLSVTLFLGIATFVRLVQVNNEDLLWVVGMNKLRGAYARIAPGIEDDFITGWTVDPRGVSKTFGAIDVTKGSALHAFVTTPAVVAVIASAIAGVLAGLVAFQLAARIEMTVVLGFAAFVISLGTMLFYGIREYERFIKRLEKEHPAPPTEAVDPADRVSSR